MRFKRSPQLPGAGRSRAWHHHGSKRRRPTSPRAIYVLKSAKGPNIFGGSVMRIGLGTYQNVSTTAMSSLIVVVIDEYVSMFIIAHTPTLKNKRIR